jgi:trehalose-phosphatase
MIAKMLNALDALDRPLLVALDFDGTIAPIVARPADAAMRPGIRACLDALCLIENVHVAVISGRAMPTLRSLVGMKSVHLAADHGLEIDMVSPADSAWLHPDVAHLTARYASLERQLLDRFGHAVGVQIENKGASLTVHYRGVHDQVEARAAAVDAANIIRGAGFMARAAASALEAIATEMKWNKGCACMHILERLFGVSWRGRVAVLYVGDDATDEDAFRALKCIPGAVTCKVDGESSRTESAASYFLRGTEDVQTLLSAILLQRQQSRHRRGDAEEENQRVQGDAAVDLVEAANEESTRTSLASSASER